MKVFLATPAYDGKIECTFARSIIDSSLYLNRLGIDSVWQYWPNGCYLPVVRNKLVRWFLQTDCTDMVFLDSDIEWSPPDLLKILAPDEEIVAGIYPYKGMQDGFPVFFKVGEDGAPKTRQNGLIETWFAPTGFMRINRGVFAKFAAKYPDIEVKEYRDNKVAETYLNFFDTRFKNNRWFGEDVDFCYRWIEIGGSVLIEPNVTLTHHGSWAWKGNLAEWLIDHPAVNSIPYINSATEDRVTKKDTPAILVPDDYSELLLGSGTDHEKRIGISGIEGWHNLTTLDINPEVHPDVLHDLNVLPLPFPDNSFNEIHAYNVLEHCGSQGDAKFFFDQFTDFWRILRPGGFIFVTVPPPSSPWALGDPGHKRVLTKEQFLYLSQKMYEQCGKSPCTDFRYMYKVDFELVSFEEVEDGDLARIILRAKKPALEEKS